MVFEHIPGAEHAYADVLDASREAPWVHEIAFVEHHRHDRIVVRGTFAGRYVDVDDQGDVIGKRTAEGALTGAVVGLFFGPMGLAVGLVGGASAGGLSTSTPWSRPSKAVAAGSCVTTCRRRRPRHWRPPSPGVPGPSVRGSPRTRGRR